VRVAEIIFELAIDHPAVGVTFEENLLVSMPCDHCQRLNRSVAFDLEGSGETKEAKCWPGSAARWGGYVEHPPYPGKLVNLAVKKTETGVKAIYQLEYETTPFVDFKYASSEWKGHPTWGRGYFVLDCPKCEKANKLSTQSNICRPREVNCTCGYLFYTENDELPVIRWQDPATGQWNQVEERFGSKQTGISDATRDN